MLMVLARLVRSESFWAVVKVRSPHTGPEFGYPRPSETRVYFKALALRTRTPGARALLPATRHRSSGPLGALLSSSALDVRLLIALQVLQVTTGVTVTFRDNFRA